MVGTEANGNVPERGVVYNTAGAGSGSVMSTDAKRSRSYWLVRDGQDVCEDSAFENAAKGVVRCGRGVLGRHAAL